MRGNDTNSLSVSELRQLINLLKGDLEYMRSKNNTNNASYKEKEQKINMALSLIISQLGSSSNRISEDLDDSKSNSEGKSLKNNGTSTYDLNSFYNIMMHNEGDDVFPSALNKTSLTTSLQYDVLFLKKMKVLRGLTKLAQLKISKQTISDIIFAKHENENANSAAENQVSSESGKENSTSTSTFNEPKITNIQTVRTIRPPVKIILKKVVIENNTINNDNETHPKNEESDHVQEQAHYNSTELNQREAHSPIHLTEQRHSAEHKDSRVPSQRRQNQQPINRHTNEQYRRQDALNYLMYENHHPDLRREHNDHHSRHNEQQRGNNRNPISYDERHLNRNQQQNDHFNHHHDHKEIPDYHRKGNVPFDDRRHDDYRYMHMGENNPDYFNQHSVTPEPQQYYERRQESDPYMSHKTRHDYSNLEEARLPWRGNEPSKDPYVYETRTDEYRRPERGPSHDLHYARDRLHEFRPTRHEYPQSEYYMDVNIKRDDHYYGDRRRYKRSSSNIKPRRRNDRMFQTNTVKHVFSDEETGFFRNKEVPVKLPLNKNTSISFFVQSQQSNLFNLIKRKAVIEKLPEKNVSNSSLLLLTAKDNRNSSTTDRRNSLRASNDSGEIYVKPPPTMAPLADKFPSAPNMDSMIHYINIIKTPNLNAANFASTSVTEIDSYMNNQQAYELGDTEKSETLSLASEKPNLAEMSTHKAEKLYSDSKLSSSEVDTELPQYDID